MITSIAHSSSDDSSATLLKINSPQEYHFISKDKKTANSMANNSDFIKKNNFLKREDSEKEAPPSIKQITKNAVDTIIPTPKMQREQTETGRNHHSFSQKYPHIKGHPFSSTSPHTTGTK